MQPSAAGTIGVGWSGAEAPKWVTSAVPSSVLLMSRANGWVGVSGWLGARRRKVRVTEPLAPGFRWPTVRCKEPATPRTITGGRRSGHPHDLRDLLAARAVIQAKA
jgi:hypothetical protein